MNKRIFFLLASTIAFAQGCAVEPPAGGDDVTSAQAAAIVATADGWQMDTSALTAIPAGGLPTKRLAPTAFSDTMVRGTLLGSQETFERTNALKTRARWQSAKWSYELDSTKGKLVAVRNDMSSATAVVADSTILGGSTNLLAAFGIPATEILRATQHDLSQTGDGSTANDVTAPQVVSHKTFVYRGLLGVPVLGHRAVVTRDLAGNVSRALVHWPALAATGHRLHTGLATTDIVARVQQTLNLAGKTPQPIQLRWVYVPDADANGNTHLTLKVAARFDSKEAGELAEESVIELVDVNAVQ